jgi:hypothetical protein
MTAARFQDWWRSRLAAAAQTVAAARSVPAPQVVRLDVMEPRMLLSAAPALSIQVADQGAVSAFNFKFAKCDQTKIAQVALVNRSDQDIHIVNLGGLKQPFFVYAADDADYDNHGDLVVSARDGVILNLAFRPGSGAREAYDDVLRVVADDGSVLRFSIQGVGLRQDVNPENRVKVVTPEPVIDPDAQPPAPPEEDNNPGPLAQPQPPRLQAFTATAVVSNARQLAAVVQQEGAHVMLRAGTYTLDSLSLAPGVQLVGENMSDTVIVLTSQWGSLCVSGSNRVADLTLIDQGDDAAVIDNGTTVSDVLLERVRIARGSPSGVFGAFARAAFIDCVFAQADQHLLYLRNCTDIRIEGCRMGDAGTTGVKLVASGGSVNRVLIRNNVFTSGNVFQHIGAKINGDWDENAGRRARSQELFDITIVGNRFDTTVGATALFEVDNTNGLLIRGNSKDVAQTLWEGYSNTNVTVQ